MSGSRSDWLLRRLDAALRWREGIFEFTADPNCVFRLSVAPAGRALTLSDGAAIAVQDPVARLHYWNEQMPLIPATGHGPGWASHFHRRVVHSLALIAELLARDPRFADVAALSGAPAFAAAAGISATVRIGNRLGFDVLDDRPALNPVHRWLDSVLIWNLMRMYNPVSVRGRPVPHDRAYIWMSRRTLLARYGSRQERGAPASASMEQP